jgi:hypothetical protein
VGSRIFSPLICHLVFQQAECAGSSPVVPAEVLDKMIWIFAASLEGDSKMARRTIDAADLLDRSAWQDDPHWFRRATSIHDLETEWHLDRSGTPYRIDLMFRSEDDAAAFVEELGHKFQIPVRR